MSPNMLFFGEYRKKLDTGCRLVIPSNLLKHFEADPILVGYVKPGEKCIRFYDKISFEEMIEQVVKGADEEMQPKFMRHFSINSRTFELDNRKRVRIPDKFCNLTGLHSNVVIVGLGTRFEVWDEETYDEIMFDVGDIPNITAPF